MAKTSKTRIKNINIDPHSIKLPDKYKIDKDSTTVSNEESKREKNNESSFETMVEKYNRKKPKKPPERRPSHHRGHGRISNLVCVKDMKTSEIFKVRREDAEQKLIPTGRFQYTSKTEWRNFLAQQQKDSSLKTDETKKKSHRKKKSQHK